MSTYKHTLTEGEEVCGVTLDDVADMMPKVLVRGDRVILPEYAPPALAGSVARCVFSGADIEFDGMVLGRMPAYRRTPA